ncbi:MAG: hypothetical protein U0531_18330 [Dehalococcoidia bacterium]
MSVRANTSHNPLAEVARAVPDRYGWLLSVLGRGVAAGLAIALAGDQAYPRTRTMAIVVAALIVVTLMPASGRWGQRLQWIGAGMAFFGGAPLWSFTLGKLILGCGVLAAAGAAIDDVHRGRMTGVSSFFTGFGVTSLAILVVLLLVKG